MNKKNIVYALMVLLIIALGVFVGLLLLGKNADTINARKLENIAYNEDNKAPRFIIVLPENQQTAEEEKASDTTNQSTDNAPKKNKTVVDTSEILQKIPLLNKLSKKEDPVAMAVIERNAELVDANGLPKVSEKNQKPWFFYSKEVEVLPSFYKISIVIENAGLHYKNTEIAIDTMPENVSFSFSPYAKNIEKQIINARKKGHETYADLLLFPKDLLKQDNGPLAISATKSEEENRQIYNKFLSVKAPIGGVIIKDGIVDDENPESIKKLLQNIQKRGLLMVDALKENHVAKIDVAELPRQKADIIIDSGFSKENIVKQLYEAEKIAKKQGHALIVVAPKPVALLEINDWISSFSNQDDFRKADIEILPDKPFVLVPLSSVVVE